MSDLSEEVQVGAFTVATAALSDCGRVRRLNEDRFLVRPALGLWAVADGMGGHGHGDVASARVIEALAAIGTPVDGRGFVAAAEGKIAEAHAALVALGRDKGRNGVIGTTVVVLLFHRDRYVCLWAGDSRLYLLRDGVLWQITRDHSPVQDLLDAGVIDAEAARHHPEANVISRAVGVEPGFALDSERGDLLDGDVFLLCTDGLTKVVAESVIADALAGSAAAAARRLTDLALDAGAPDNVTVVVVACEADDITRRPPGDGGH
jgi:serine/threonine protein phosphatase PrpC